MEVVQSSKIKNQSTVKSSKPEVKVRAFYLSVEVIKFVDSLNGNSSSRIVVDQLVRSITSIGANIVEAKSSSSKREFLNYFQISLKSANESKYWLALLRELIPTQKAELNVFFI